MLVGWSINPWPLCVASASCSLTLGFDMRSPNSKAEIESRPNVLLRPRPGNWQGALLLYFMGKNNHRASSNPRSEWQLGA